MPRKQTFDDWLIVLQLYVEGKTTHEIAALTCKSCHTVEAYLKRIRAHTRTPHITAAYRIMLLRGHIKLQWKSQAKFIPNLVFFTCARFTKFATVLWSNFKTITPDITSDAVVLTISASSSVVFARASVPKAIAATIKAKNLTVQALALVIQATASGIQADALVVKALAATIEAKNLIIQANASTIQASALAPEASNLTIK